MFSKVLLVSPIMTHSYIDGLITAKEAIQRVKVIPSVFQMSFHTLLALSYIDQSLTEYQQRVKGSSWSVWKKAFDGT